jgi:ubiquinone/menaquinone biosynthesis C-methylase UbiE
MIVLAMTYSPIDAETKWYKSSAPTTFGEKHNFPHRLVHSKLASYIAEIGCNSDSTILDVGCGAGDETEFINPLSKNIMGVDIVSTAIDSFRTRGFEGLITDVRYLPFKDESFDFVVCPEILHHLRGQGNLIDFLIEFSRVLKTNGYLVTLEPNAFSVSGMMMNIANTIKPGITGLVPHERALSPISLKKNFNKANLKNVKCIAASYVWNRFLLRVSQLIARHEDVIRFKTPCNYFGWFSIVSGQKIQK